MSSQRRVSIAFIHLCPYIVSGRFVQPALRRSPISVFGYVCWNSIDIILVTLVPVSTYRMSAVPHQPQRHHTELQLRGRYVPVGTRLRNMHQTVREHLSGRIPAGVRLRVRYQLVGRSVLIVNRNYSGFKKKKTIKLFFSLFHPSLWQYYRCRYGRLRTRFCTPAQ